MVFKLWDRFGTLPDAPLDPLDRYKNQRKNDFLDIFFVSDPWPAISGHLNKSMLGSLQIEDFDWSFTLS